MAWYYAHLVEACATAIALIFVILALATENWLSVKLDMVEPAPEFFYSYCADPSPSFAGTSPISCFGIYSCIPTPADISRSVMATSGVYIPPFDIRMQTLPPDPTPYGDACVVYAYGLNPDDKVKLLTAVNENRVAINVSFVINMPVHTLMSNDTTDGTSTGVAVHIGLFNICAKSQLPFDPRVEGESADCASRFATTVCVKKSDVCDYLTGDCLPTNFSMGGGRQEDFVSDAFAVCKRILATSILQCFALVAALVAAISAIWAAVRHIQDVLEEPRWWVERLPIFVAFVLQLCAVAVWGSMYTLGKALLDFFFPNGKPYWEQPYNATAYLGVGTPSLSSIPFPLPHYQTVDNVRGDLGYSFAFAVTALGLQAIAIIFQFSRKRASATYEPVPTAPSPTPHTYPKYGALGSEAEETRGLAPRRG